MITTLLIIDYISAFGGLKYSAKHKVESLDSFSYTYKAMPIKRYEIWIDEDNLIFVYFTTVKGKLVDFVVKYISYIDGEPYEILRYDCTHNVPHIDILDSEGNTIEKQWLPHLNFKQALTSARYDIEHNYTFYRERFIKWLKEKN